MPESPAPASKITTLISETPKYGETWVQSSERPASQIHFALKEPGEDGEQEGQRLARALGAQAGQGEVLTDECSGEAWASPTGFKHACTYMHTEYSSNTLIRKVPVLRKLRPGIGDMTLGLIL